MREKQAKSMNTYASSRVERHGSGTIPGIIPWITPGTIPWVIQGVIWGIIQGITWRIILQITTRIGRIIARMIILQVIRIITPGITWGTI